MAILDDLPTLHGGAAALREALAAGPQRRVLTGLKGSSLPLLLARLDRELEDDPRPWVLLTSLGAEAEGLAEDLRTFGATGVEHFPELEILPFDRHSADRNLVARRVAPSRMAICAAPGYLREHGAPRHPRDRRPPCEAAGARERTATAPQRQPFASRRLRSARSSPSRKNCNPLSSRTTPSPLPSAEYSSPRPPRSSSTPSAGLS